MNSCQLWCSLLRNPLKTVLIQCKSNELISETNRTSYEKWLNQELFLIRIQLLFIYLLNIKLNQINESR